MEVESKVIVVCCVVAFLGLLSAATAFAAEAKRIKGDKVRYPSISECMYPRSPALGLGLTAAVALMMAQIIINVATGCVCCIKGPHQSNSNWTLALACFIVSWFTYVIAFLVLLTGAALNEEHGEEKGNFGNYYCYTVKPGVFAGGGVLSLASVFLGILYYVLLNSGKKGNNRWGAAGGESGIVMGQPQFPSEDPVFVHQDTYMRRQLI